MRTSSLTQPQECIMSNRSETFGRLLKGAMLSAVEQRLSRSPE
jgi:hypothetical protein